MKKLLVAGALLALGVTAASMGHTSGSYEPGIYRASKDGTHNSGFGYTTFITMTVDESGMIDNVLIDTTFPVDRNDLNKGYSTKQSLGADYGMAKASSIGAEWNEQADAIGAHVVANQGVKFTMKDDRTTDDIAGATMKVHAYKPLLEALVEEAKVK